MRRPSHSELTAVLIAHKPVEPLQIRDGLVKGAEIDPFAVNEGLFAEDDMAVAVIRYLMAAVEHTADEPVVMYSPALLVPPKVGIVVVGHAAPRGRAEASRLVRVIFRGIADNVERPLRAELLKGVQYHVGKRSSAEEVRRGGHIHRPVVKRHGYNAARGLHPL